MRADRTDGNSQTGIVRIDAPRLTFSDGGYPKPNPHAQPLGWYVEAATADTDDNGCAVRSTKISPDAALLIAEAFDLALSTSLGHTVDHFEAGVRQQNEFAAGIVRENAERAQFRAEMVAIQHAAQAKARAAEMAEWGHIAPAEIAPWVTPLISSP